MTQKTTGWYEKVFFILLLTIFKHTKFKKSASIKNCFPAIMQSFKEKAGQRMSLGRSQMYSEYREMVCV